MDDLDARLYAYSQQAKSAAREADGQCQECGAFRLDGKPPTVHRTGCTGRHAAHEEVEGG